MGRKEAPQPLSLANNSYPHSEPRVASPRAFDLPASDPNVLGSQGQTSPRIPIGGIGIASSGETSLQIVSTPASSKSPRSPRSPFSKFNPSKKTPTQAEPHATSPSQQQSYFPSPSPAQSDTPQLHYKAGPVAENYEQEYYHYPQQPQIVEFSQNPDVSDPDVEPTVTTPALREGAGQFQLSVSQPQQQQRTQHPHAHEEEKHARSASRFFNFNKPAKPSQQPRDHHRERDIKSHQNQHRNQESKRRINPAQTDSDGEAMSRGVDHAAMVDRISTKSSKQSDKSSDPNSTHKAVPTLPSRSDLSLASVNADNDLSSSKKKPKPFTLLSRTRSVKDKDSPSPKEGPSQHKIQEPERAQTFATQPLRTAPIDREAQDQTYRQRMDSSTRNQSVDRALPREMANKDARSDKENRSHPSSFKDNNNNNGGSNFFSGLKSSGSRAADMLHKGLFGSKSGRSGSTSEREHPIDDEHYQIKVINLPLVEQTRLTRISKKLEESRDKTEFWMPAFPWRAIDYLNFKGSEVEGLYRVPGSGPQIKKWQRRFDEEYDVDLFAQDDLYDINIIGSMLKAWLRELPDELFPKEAQDRIARECIGAEKVPQLLIDELSNLSPYNYYLLFAITCHLSLLLAHSDKNKMDFRNLCICFQPCMKIDVFCFRFLVCNWRECWQGCKNEAKYIEVEYALLKQPPPNGLGGVQSQRNGNGDGYSNGSTDSGGRREIASSHGERNVSSSDSGTQSMLSHDQQQQQQQQQHGKLRKPSAVSHSNGNATSNRLVNTSLTVNNTETPRRSGDLRPLSPIKPLSPLGF